MADKPKGDKKFDKKPSGGGMKSDTDVLAIIFIVVVGLALVSALVASFQNRYASGGHIDLDVAARNGVFFLSSRVNEFTSSGALVATKRTADVWASSLRDHILGVQERGSLGRLIANEIIGTDVWWNVDFEKSPDGWVSADDLKKQFEGGVATFRFWLLLISGVLTVLGTFLALYSWRRWMLITTTKRKEMQQLEKKLVEKDIANKNERWEHVLALISSDNPADWRVAIMEADIMLDELVGDMGYQGEGLGERLKAIEKSDFTTLDLAWEAHKVRNNIAHHGSDFILTHREAKRTIDLFRKVFEEFDYV
jgi:hypothetical protein